MMCSENVKKNVQNGQSTEGQLDRDRAVEGLIVWTLPSILWEAAIEMF